MDVNKYSLVGRGITGSRAGFCERIALELIVEGEQNLAGGCGRWQPGALQFRHIA